MYTAVEARKKSQQSLDNQFQKEKKLIEQKVMEAIEDGDFQCYLGCSISIEASNWLNDLGFKVEHRNFQDYMDTIVQW